MIYVTFLSTFMTEILALLRIYCPSKLLMGMICEWKTQSVVFLTNHRYDFVIFMKCCLRFAMHSRRAVKII